jgi:hypothetical protein
MYMSTPAGRPVNPINPFAHAPHETRERAGLEAQPFEHDNNPLRTERHPVENDHDPLRSPDAPKNARTPPAVEPDFATSEDAAPLVPLRVPEDLRQHPERHAVDVDQSDPFSYGAPGGARTPDGSLFNKRGDHSLNTAPEEVEVIAEAHPVDLDSAASLQPADPNRQRHEQSTAYRRDEIIRERLEASLRWVQRKEAASRLPRATQLPAVPGLPPIDAGGRRHSDERFGRGVRPEPERLVPSPSLRSRRDHLRWPLRILIASIFAAPIAYYFSVGGWAPSTRGPRLASLDPMVVAPSTSEEQRQPTRAQDRDPGRLAQNEILTDTS